MTNKKRFTAIGILTAVLIAIITCLSFNLYGNKAKGTYAATADARYYYVNKTVDLPSTARGSSFSFSSRGQSFNYIRFSATNGLQYMTNGSSSSEAETVIVYTSANGWINELYRYIYVSNITGQDTPSYLLSNAVETIAPVIYAGTYTWYDSLELWGTPSNYFDMSVEFTSNGQKFTAFGANSTQLRYRYPNNKLYAYVYNFTTEEWSDAAYKEITLTPDTAIVPDFFYSILKNFASFSTVDEPTTYTINYNLKNATKETSAPTEITSDGKEEITISARSGYSFVKNPTATNATAQWNGDQKSGVLTITEPTDNVTVNAIAQKDPPTEYSATITATATGSNANKIDTISPNTLTLASGETQKIVVGITDNAYTVTQLNYETGISATFEGNVITVTADTLTENKTINLQISAGLNEASNEQYQAGYDDGEKAGYESGIKDGEETGYNNGYTAGLEDGKANATVGQQLTYITQIKDSKINITDITPYLDSTKTTLNLGTIPGINSDDSYTAIRFSVNSDLIESDNINFTINWYNGGIVSGTNGFNTTFRAYATYTNMGVKSFDFKSVNNIYTITLPKTYNGESDTIKDFYFTLEKPMPTDIVIVSKSTEFTNGYNSGYTNGMEQGKETGYQQGKEEGLTEGKTQGYQDGYNKGIEEGASLNGLILSIAQVPIDFITNCFNVTILGINIAGLITGFITAAVVIWILKKLL